MSRIKVLNLKIISLAAIFSFIYPVVMYIRCDNFYITGGIATLIYELLLIIGGFFAGEYLTSEKSVIYGFLTSRTTMKVFFENERSVRLCLNLLALLSVIVPILITLVINSGSSGFRIFYEVLTAAIFYLIGIFQANKDYQKVLSTAKIVTGSIITFALLFVSGFFSWASYLKPVLYGFAYAFIILCMVVKNLSNLDTNIYLKKGAEKTPVSRKVRKKNIIYTFIIFLATAVLFNVKQVYQLIYGCIRAIVAAFSTAFWAFTTLIGSLFNTTEPLKGGNGKINLTARGGKTSIVATALTIVLIIALVHFTYKFLTSHWDRIKSYIHNHFNSLMDKIRRIFKLMGNDGIRIRKPSVFEYEDEIEKIDPVSKSGLHRSKDSSEPKRRSFIKYKDPVKRVREGYAYIVERLASKRIDIKKSNTPSEICSKTTQIEGFGEQFEIITKIYESVRYDDSVPSENEMNTFDENSSKVVHMLKKLP